MPAMTMIRRTKSRERKRVFFHNKYYRWPDDLCTMHTHTQFKFHFFVAFFLLFLLVFFCSFLFQNYWFCCVSCCACEKFLGDKTLANDHTAAATVEASAVRSNRKLYMITARFTANNKHNQMADRHYYFDFFYPSSSSLSLLSSFFLAVSCLPLFYTYIIHTLFVCWYFLQHNSLALQFCCVDVYDCTIWWVGDHTKRKKERETKNSKPNKTTNKHIIIYSSKTKQRHTRNRKKYAFFVRKNKIIFILKHIRYTHSFGFVELMRRLNKTKRTQTSTRTHAHNINAFWP